MIRLVLATGAVGALLAVAPVVQPPAIVTIEAVVTRTGAFVGGLGLGDCWSFVCGLTRDDFIVTVDDVEIPVSDSVVDDGPVSVVVMIDITASTVWPGPEGFSGTEKPLNDDLLAQFRKEDRVRFASLGRRVVMASGFTTDRRLTRQGLIEAIAPRPEERSGPSPIWDALDAALSALEPEAGRRAVILLSDGHATGNHKDLSEVADRAIALGIPVSTVATGQGTMILAQASNQLALIRPGLALERLSDATGGLAVAMAGSNPNEPSPLTTTVIGLRRAYFISFTTSHTDGQFHRVTVRTRDAGHRVRARAAFRAPGGQGGGRLWN